MDTILQTLLDERDVTALLHRYASALDGRDWDRLRTCFQPDAVADYEGTAQCDGYEAIEQVCRRALTRLDRSHHLVGNVQVAVDGDTATTECYLQAQHVVTGTPGGDTFIIAGRYVDEVVRTEQGWRIARRRLEVWWTDGNPAVIGR